MIPHRHILDQLAVHRAAADFAAAAVPPDTCPRDGTPGISHKGFITCPTCGDCLRELRADEGA